MANTGYGKYQQNSQNKPSAKDIISAFSQVSGIMKENGISGDYSGAKKALDMAGISLAQLKEYRNQAPMYINNPIGVAVLKSQNVDGDKFLGFIDDFIKQYENEIGSANVNSGNRQTRRMEQGFNNTYNNNMNNANNWRNR